MGQQDLPCQLERSQGLLAAHRWKIVEKVVESVAGFEVVDQGLDRHPYPLPRLLTLCLYWRCRAPRVAVGEDVTESG